MYTIQINLFYRDFKEKENELASYVYNNGSVGVGVNAVMWHDYVGMKKNYF